MDQFSSILLFIPLDNPGFIASFYLETIEDYINLELCSPCCLGIMERYYFNPISLTKKTRHFFPNIQTYWRYNPNDPRFTKDKRIKIRKEFLNIKCNLNISQYNKLEEWTHKKMKEILFDTKKNNWKKDTSEFDTKIFNKKKFIILIETENDIKFGCYVDGKIDKYYYYDNGSDSIISCLNSFVFTFKNNTIEKFDIKKDKSKYAFYLYPKSSEILFEFGYNDISIRKDNNSFKCSCIYQEEDSSFDYKGKENALIGIIGSDCFKPKRIVVIQMKK